MPIHVRAVAALGLALGLAACAPEPVPVEPYPFAGTWDCGAQTFTFTDTTWNNGTQTLPILSVARDGWNYTLFFPSGYMFALVAVTETGMTWVSGKTGNKLNCRRL
jgi:hypothetical protein